MIRYWRILEAIDAVELALRSLACQWLEPDTTYAKGASVLPTCSLRGSSPRRHSRRAAIVRVSVCDVPQNIVARRTSDASTAISSSGHDSSGHCPSAGRSAMVRYYVVKENPRLHKPHKQNGWVCVMPKMSR